MNILILGAGQVGSNVAYQLAREEANQVTIVDINAGSHGKYFATNFDPEINFREFTGVVYSWQGGEWQTNKMFEIGKTYEITYVGGLTYGRIWAMDEDDTVACSSNHPEAPTEYGHWAPQEQSWK